MRIRWITAQIGPLIMIGISALLLAAVFSQQRPVVDLGAINLGAGAVSTVTFKPEYSTDYAIGLRMDKNEVARLFPCMADPLADWGSKCKGEHPQVWPVSLSVSVTENGVVIPSMIDPSIAGGSYSDKYFFRSVVILFSLRGRQAYQVTVRSFHSIGALVGAHPRLAAEIHDDGFVEGLGLKYCFVIFISIVLFLGGLAWGALRMMKLKNSTIY